MRHSDDRIPDLNTRGFIAVKNTPVAHSTTAECKMKSRSQSKLPNICSSIDYGSERALVTLQGMTQLKTWCRESHRPEELSKDTWILQ